MNGHSLPAREVIWARHVELVLNVMVGGLERLRMKKELPDSEKDLDKLLFVRAHESYHALERRNRPATFALDRQTPCVHQDDKEIDEQWTDKKPDFKWRLHDDTSTFDDPIMEFHIECKRLGLPTSPGWVLNRQYIRNGVARFLCASHRYGNGVSAGAMIGYIQSMKPSEILEEVNEHLRKNCGSVASVLDFSPVELDDIEVARTAQSLERDEVAPREFTLHHVWVDLRRN